MDIGQRVREIRKDMGMPVAELARRTEVSRNAIVMIEAGQRKPSMGLLERIARELRVEPANLLKEPALASPEGKAPDTGPSDRLGEGHVIRVVVTDQAAATDSVVATISRGTLEDLFRAVGTREMSPDEAMEAVLA